MARSSLALADFQLGNIDEAEKAGLTSFYVEIIVKEGFRAVKALDEDDFDEE